MKSILSTPVHFVQHKLDNIAMYRTVTLGLTILAGYSITLGFFGILPYTVFEQVLSLGTALVVGLVLNVVFAFILRVPANHESSIITALIVFFLMVPAQTLTDQWFIAATVALAITSKFVICYRRQHIFNPAAFAAVIIGVTGLSEPGWWIGTPQMLIPLLIIGSLVVMKIRKWTPVLWFLAFSFIVYLFESWRLDLGVIESIPIFFTSWPALFLAFFMLTEPFTLPPTKQLQAGYGALIGFLSSAAFFGPYVSMTPELALLIGNIAFYPFTLRQKLYLTLIEKKELAKNTFEFVFKKPHGFHFRPGQYLEWTLQHAKPDSRGIRRYFTIAAGPEEDVVLLGVRTTDDNPSTFKQALLKLEPGDTVTASQLAGDFMLPHDRDEKCAFVAGGIGVTPFRSFLGHMKFSDDKRDAVLYYANNTEAEIAYRDMFDQASNESNFKTVHVLAKEEKEGFEHGYLTEEIVKRHTPDFNERTWFLSGPPGMVNAYKSLLCKMGVPRKQIKTDFFPGLA